MKSKKFLVIIFSIIGALILLFIIGSVMPDPKPSFKPQPPDTVQTAITYIDGQNRSGHLDIVFRIAKDTSYLDSVSPGTYKKIEKRDSFYYVPVWVASRDSTGRVVNDSTGKPVPVLSYQLLNKLLVLQDYNKQFK